MAEIHRFVLLMFLVIFFGQKCAKSANMGCKEVKYKFERSAKMSKDSYESLLVPESGKLHSFTCFKLIKISPFFRYLFLIYQLILLTKCS